MWRRVAFILSLLFYLFKVTLEGSGGGSGYMLQRYFAARSDREAGLRSLLWTCLLAFRWPLIASLAMLTYAPHKPKGSAVNFARSMRGLN